MSKKTHFKVLGVDYRRAGQSQKLYDSQSVCGFAGVTVTKNQDKVDCKLCIKLIDDAQNADDLSLFGGGHG